MVLQIVKLLVRMMTAGQLPQDTAIICVTALPGLAIKYAKPDADVCGLEYGDHIGDSAVLSNGICCLSWVMRGYRQTIGTW